MASESLSFDILAHDHASREIKNVGQAAADTAGKLDIAAASMALFDKTTQQSGKAAATSQAAFKQHAKAAGLLADAEDVLAGKAAGTTRALENQGSAAEKSAKQLGSLAGSGGPGVGPMGALIGAGVALSPVLATLAVGLGGLGIAAVGVIEPIVKASQATGGLKANLDTLDPAQQAAAKSLLTLESTYKQFENALSPVILKDFNAAIAQVGPLLHDIEPVAQATGKGLVGLFGQIGGIFKSGQWQQFFQFMAAQAIPDLQQLGTAFAGFAKGLPGIVEDLTPVSNELLQVVGEVGQLSTVLGTASQAIDKAGHSSTGAENPLGHFTDIMKNLGINVLTFGAPAIKSIAQHFEDSGKAADTAATHTGKYAQVTGDLIHQVGPAAEGTGVLARSTGLLAAAQAKATGTAETEKQAVADLTGALNGQVSALLAAQGGEVAWKQAQDAATTAIKANKNALDGNSASALAARSALIQSSSAAISAANAQVTLHHNVAAASQIINNQIAYLQQHAAHSQVAAQEILALVQSEAKLPANVTSKVHVDTTTARLAIAGLQRQLSILNGEVVTTYVSTKFVAPTSNAQGKIRRAAGGIVPGTGSGDTVPALLTPGEVVIPKGMVAAGAVDHLRGSLPGFAGGGLVQHVNAALHDVRAHPGHPAEQHRLAASLATTRGHISADRQLLRVGHLSAEQARHTTATLRGELAHQASLLHQLGPLRHERAEVSGAAGDLSHHDAALRTAAAAAARRGLTGVARHLRSQLGTGEAHEKQLTNWLNKVQIDAAAAAKRKQAQQAAAAASAASAATAAAAAAAVQANTSTITSYLATFEPGLSGTSLNAAEAAFGVPGVQKFDQGGLLKPGLTLALNATGRPEPVIPAGRGGGNTYNLNVTVGAGTHPAEAGRQIVAHIREFEKRSGSSWRN